MKKRRTSSREAECVQAAREGGEERVWALVVDEETDIVVVFEVLEPLELWVRGLSVLQGRKWSKNERTLSRRE